MATTRAKRAAGSTAQQKRLSKAIEESKAVNKVEQLEIDTERSERIKELANRITELPGFSFQEFLRITKIANETFRSWRLKGVDNPQESTMDAIRRYLRIPVQPFDDYVRYGKITLDELWESLNSDLGNKSNPDRVVSAFRLLSLDEKLETLARLPELLIDEVNLLKEAQKEPEIEYVELSDRARLRLKELLKMSMLFKQFNESDLIKKGADGALIESIQENKNDKYTKESFLTLTPFLCCPIQWTNNLPVVDPNSAFGESLDEMIKEIEA